MEFPMIRFQTQNTNFLSPMISTTTKQALVHKWAHQKGGKGNSNSSSMIKCGKSTNYVVELKLKRELEEIENEGKEWREMKNCKGETTTNANANTKMVELLECLEKEAIMGDDEGREPVDYNRRAQIFDKSSKVFQALKELHTSDFTKTEH